jgi:hypothetical protein
VSIKEAVGLGSDKKVRYAIAALGDIAQEAMLPGVEHTGNSEVTAFVTSDPAKGRHLLSHSKLASCRVHHSSPAGRCSRTRGEAARGEHRTVQGNIGSSEEFEREADGRLSAPLRTGHA